MVLWWGVSEAAGVAAVWLAHAWQAYTSVLLRSKVGKVWLLMPLAGGFITAVVKGQMDSPAGDFYASIRAGSWTAIGLPLRQPVS